MLFVKRDKGLIVILPRRWANNLTPVSDVILLAGALRRLEVIIRRSGFNDGTSSERHIAHRKPIP